LPRAQSRPNANISQVEKSDWIHFVTPRHRRDTVILREYHIKRHQDQAKLFEEEKKEEEKKEDQ
jgi:hypothetical protein